MNVPDGFATDRACQRGPCRRVIDPTATLVLFFVESDAYRLTAASIAQRIGDRFCNRLNVLAQACKLVLLLADDADQQSDCRRGTVRLFDCGKFLVDCHRSTLPIGGSPIPRKLTSEWYTGVWCGEHCCGMCSILSTIALPIAPGW